MSKTITSGSELWPQDTPSQPPISTTSADGVWIQMGKFTRTGRERLLVYSFLVSAITAILFSWVFSIYFSTHTPSGMVLSGYAPQPITKGGMTVDVYYPVYMKNTDYKKYYGGIQ